MRKLVGIPYLIAACIVLTGCGGSTASYRCEGAITNKAQETPATVFIRIEEYSWPRRLRSALFGGDWSNAGWVLLEAPKLNLSQMYHGLEKNGAFGFGIYEYSERTGFRPEGGVSDVGSLKNLSDFLDLWTRLGRFEGDCVRQE